MGLPPQGKSPSQNKSTTAIIWLRVRFELGARNGLRRVVFAMEKNNKPNGVPQWVVQFQLFERRSRAEQWTQMANLRVDLDTKQNAKAATVAARGLSDEQAARAVGPAADDTLAGKRGELAVAESRQSVKDIVK